LVWTWALLVASALPRTDSHNWSASDLGGGMGIRYTDLSLVATTGAFSMVLGLALLTVVMIRPSD
jgi:hypothetical protein